MYVPAKYSLDDAGAMRAVAAASTLGTLVTFGADGLDANHIPFEVCGPEEGAPFGVLHAHVARANPVWRRDGEQVMAVFQQASEYISPSRFEEKERSGRVVPTWDYTAVHMHGTLRAIDDPHWLAALLGRLTTRHEAAQRQPWAVADAPAGYIERLMAAIVGIEIRIERMDGKRKAATGLRP